MVSPGVRGDEIAAAYDQLGMHRPGEDFEAPPDWTRRYGAEEFGFEDLDLADLFANLTGRGRYRQRRPPGPMPGQDFEVTAQITLEDAWNGALVDLDLSMPEYDEQGRGFELRNVAGGWRYYTRAELSSVVEGFVLDGQQARLTQAALETLAVVAYKQPVSRARVSAIRGVNVDGVMRTLLTRGLVEEAGHDGEHGATLYRTTAYFLERIGITSLDELPELAPYLPDMDDLEDDLAEAVAPHVTDHMADTVTEAVSDTA